MARARRRNFGWITAFFSAAAASILLTAMSWHRVAQMADISGFGPHSPTAENSRPGPRSEDGERAADSTSVRASTVAETSQARGEGCQGTGPMPSMSMPSCCDKSTIRKRTRKKQGATCDDAFRPMSRCRACRAGKRCKVEISKCRPCGVRLHFLFLVVDIIYHMDLWQTWLMQAPVGSWDAWVHCAKGCNETMFQLLPALQKVPTVRTQWCLDLTTAHVQLLGAAQRAFSKQRGSADILEKYILIGHNTLPSKPFRKVYEALSAYRESDFCFMGRPLRDETGYPGWPRATINSGEYFLPKHGQFVILNEEDAAEVVRNWRVPKPRVQKGKDRVHNARWDVPLVFGKELIRIENSAFFSEDHQTCADEYGIFASAYGAFRPGESTRDASICPLNYSHGCGTLESLKNERRCPTFSVTGVSDLLVLRIASDPKSNVSFPTWDGPGFEFLKLSKKALKLIKKTPNLFIRKFTKDARLDRYAEILLS